MKNTVAFTHYPSPIGKLRLRAIDKGMLAVDHVCQQETTGENWINDATHSILKHAIQELDEYFSSNRWEFTVPLAPKGTAFQQEVWGVLQTIPYGETRSYSEVAQIIGQPSAVRAVGAANGRNPLSIFIPCHRVIGKNGKLTGYAGGMQMKQWLLAHETLGSAYPTKK